MIDESFKDFILDQLAGLDKLRVKKMFGSFGLYCGDKFFAIISDDVLYFKTNPETAKRYIEAGMTPFAPSPDQILKNYYQVPDEILESPEIVGWANQSICALSQEISDRSIM